MKKKNSNCGIIPSIVKTFGLIQRSACPIRCNFDSEIDLYLLNMKIDLHSHSSISYDGGITAQQYEQLFIQNSDLYIAITDHNEVSLALELHEKIGNQVIVGEEIMTKVGEVIGLFLQRKIEPNMSLLDTIAEIKKQNGSVYVPHPFEKTRKGLSLNDMQIIAPLIDIIEGFNARSREPWLSVKVQTFAREHSIPIAASSDAHGVRGLLTAYNEISEAPTSQNLADLIRQGNLVQKHASLLSLFDPFKNKFKKRFL